MQDEISTGRVRKLITDRDLATLGSRVRKLSQNRVVKLLSELPLDQAAIVFRLLEKNESLAVFEELDQDTQADLITVLSRSQVLEIFRSLDPEEQTWLLDEMPSKVAKKIVAALGSKEMEGALSLLGYPRESIGRRMSPQVLRSRPTETVGELLGRIRASNSDNDVLSEIPVLTKDRKLVGKVELKALLEAEKHAQVATLMEADPYYSFTYEDDEKVAREILRHGELIHPIVDSERRLVGIVPLLDAARIDYHAAEEDHARAGGAEPLRRPYLLTSVLKVARSRIVWLLVLGISATLTVQVLEIFEATLSQKIALSLFIPLVIGIGGNTGSQAATTVTRALATGEIDIKDVGRVAFKEVRTGFAVGSLLALVALAIASAVYGFDIGLVIALTLALNCPIAATVGGVIPLVAKACKVDPAVFSTPFISTFCDASGLLVYFLVAKALLGL
ncbi:MAG: magnesium transporter [Winkia neuii]|uniref:Magnesium transporter MgtE n=1 Tax=Winkia neuii TaxID=33007 RepID=A0A2I1ILX0_9ACTO|nr:magnesium transporter [Winkia neuii]OFJ70773.1 magnesium transporter [Actinomyces sp. HMSC064C12]OFK02518.1 magnesium transporter [Actinomyces sp. HMSC072A03]OFT53831.1 magnesium transporter [Actinomyces sp. HMSC06A08]KWZ74895.1 magnesium transporter [Winkia neuii]MDK8099253.1 magnesium transporter [Winkia neuii]